MSTAPRKPTVVLRNRPIEESPFRLIPAALASLILNGGLICVALLFGPSPTTSPAEQNKVEEGIIQADPIEPKGPDLVTSDIDPAALEPDTDINYKVERKAEVSIPGMVNPIDAVGILDGDKTRPPTNLPLPSGMTGRGQGGALEAMTPGSSSAVGMVGGNPRALPLAGTFYGRSGATREQALRDGGGTKESEAAVVLGLEWLKKIQSSDGRWALDGNFPDKGTKDDVAGTAFGLLPFLGAGKTHKVAEQNPYDKTVEKGLLYLIRKQDKRTGKLGKDMYSHGLATIALCEAYGLTQDPVLRRPAQSAIYFIVQAQHAEGGWRYSPGQAGDTSVAGWQVMALKSAQMAGLDVPDLAMRKAQNFINSVCDEGDEGYGYTGKGSTPTMTAVGLLCRQYLQSWGSQNLRLIKGIDNHIKPYPPGRPVPPGNNRNMYYYYYATQVMHHFGGQAWHQWNEKMREDLIRRQDKSKGNEGSWSPAGDAYGGAGGRLMNTSLSLLTLEVYYRHLPLYYRDPGEKRLAGQ